MSITFKRVIRDCPHNQNLQANGETKGLIYDFNVMIGGEHRAIMKRNYRGNGYNVYDPDHQSIKVADDHRSAYPVRDQSQFEHVINMLWSKDRIPSLAQLEEARAERQRKADEHKAEEIERDRIWRIKDAGPDLLVALEAILFQVAQGKVLERDACITQARAVVAAAKAGDA